MEAEQDLVGVTDELIQMGFEPAAIADALALFPDKQAATNYLLSRQVPGEFSLNVPTMRDEEDEWEEQEEDYKMIFVIRMDLKLPFARIIELVATGALKAYRTIQSAAETDQFKEFALHEWMECGHRKIVVKAPHENEVKKILEQAKAKKISCCGVYGDSTGLHSQGSDQLLIGVVGPESDAQIDQFTKHLKLY